MAREIWKRANLDGELLNYDVSDLGRVRHTETHHIKSVHFTRGGYRIVSMYLPHVGKLRMLKVSRLVADAFLRPRTPDEQIEHLDQDRTNDRVGNLAIVDQSTNIRRSYKLTERRRGNCNRFLSPVSYQLIEDLWKTGLYSQVEIGRMCGINNSTVSKIVNGKISPRPNGRTLLVVDKSKIR